MNRILAIVALCVTAPLIAQCSVNPATGERQFTAFMSPEQERKVGAEEHPKILEQFGGVYGDDAVGGYVASIGGRLAAYAELPADQFTFTVLNDPLVNAFALPGGYVYVTRGLMALANSEAELAGVVAHEIGHVTGRHTAERYSRANVAGIGSTILGVLLGSPEVGQLAQQGSQLYLLSFSRGQELEADKLGIRYLTRTGYDPFAEADFLDTLRRHTELEAKMAGRQVPQNNFFATHPNTAKRVTEAIEEAEGAGAVPYQRPRYREQYLDAVDGLLYGADPSQGLVRGQRFWHGPLGFTFEAPDGFQIQNTPDAVIMVAGQNMGAVFDGARVETETSMTQYLTTQWAKDLRLSDLRSFTVNGMDAASAAARVASNGGTVDVRLVAIRFEGDRVYRFQLISPPPASSGLINAFNRLVGSFRRMTAEEVASIQPRRIEVVTVQSGDTLASLAERLPYDDEYNVERLMVLNALDSPQDLKAGDRIKLIVEN